MVAAASEGCEAYYDLDWCIIADAVDLLGQRQRPLPPGLPVAAADTVSMLPERYFRVAADAVILWLPCPCRGRCFLVRGGGSSFGTSASNAATPAIIPTMAWFGRVYCRRCC